MKTILQASYLDFELVQLSLGNSVGLGDDGNDVDLAVQFFHADEIERLKSMAGRHDEVEAGVDARIVTCRERSLDFQLFLQVRLELRIDAFYD